MIGLVPDVPDLSAEEQRELLARLRAVVEARDAENAGLRAELAAALERKRRLELRVAELERRLGTDSTNSEVLRILPTERVPVWAAYWIVGGHDGEALAHLAGLHLVDDHLWQAARLVGDISGTFELPEPAAEDEHDQASE